MIRRDGRWRRRGASLWLAAFVLSLPAQAQDEAPPETPAESGAADSTPDAADRLPPPEDATPIDAALQVPPLLREDATQAERERSASELIADKRFSPLREALLGENPDASAAALAAIAESAGSPELFSLLEETALKREGADGVDAARLLSNWTSRDAVRSLARILRRATQDDRPDLARAAAASLTRITGRQANPIDPAAWLAWWSDAEWLPEADWQAALAQAHRERAAREAAEREALETTLLDLYQRLHAQTPSEGRTDLLQEMLESPRRSVRIAGLRLVERALLNGRVVDPALGAPAAAMLNDPEPEIRRLAARSLLRFAPAAGAPVALASLKSESDPETAATLMDLVSSSTPDARAAELAEPWLGRPAPAGDAAANLIRIVLEHGRSPGEAFEERVREAAALALASEPTPAVIRLLSRLGGDAELGAIAAALTEKREGAVAVAAVRAMEVMPGGLARLDQIIETDPALRPLVADALSRGAGGLAPYRFLLHISGLPAELRREALHRLWTTLEPAALVTAAEEIPSPELRAELLSATLSGSDGGGSNGRAELPADVRESLTILLAETRLEQDRLEEALASLGRLSSEAQRHAGAEVAARVLARLIAHREKGQPAPEPDAIAACAPVAWAEALRRLAEADPASALAASQWTEFSEHVRSDEAAGAVFDEAIRKANRAIAADSAGEAEQETEETNPPGQGVSNSSVRPATRP